jgi:DNA-binding transcriptional LysR family regulator
LHVTQPPLSRAIRQLEEELGVQLLVRTSRSVRPTPAGLAFEEQAREVLARVKLAVAEAQRAAGVDSILRFGCTPYVSVETLQEFLGALHERVPDLQIEVTELVAVEQVARVRAAELDLGIFTYVDLPPGLEVEPLFPGARLAALLPAGHPLASKELLGPAELEDEILVVSSVAANPALNRALLERYAAAGYRFRGLQEATSLGPREAVLAVAGGLGVAFVPEWVADGWGSDDMVTGRPIEPVLSLPPMVVAWRANPPRQLAEIIAVVRDLARELHAIHDRDSTGIESRRAGI